MAPGRRDARPDLTACLKAIHPGNTLVIWKLNRLGRDLRHLVDNCGVAKHPRATRPLVYVFVLFLKSGMNRITRRDLHDHIFVAIKCAPPTVIAGLRGKLPVQNDQACNALTELILRQVEHEHRGVFDWSPPPPNLFPKIA